MPSDALVVELRLIHCLLHVITFAALSGIHNDNNESPSSVDITEDSLSIHVFIV